MQHLEPYMQRTRHKNTGQLRTDFLKARFWCRYDLKLDFLAAVFGADREFEAQHLEQCGSCDGTGARGGSSRKTCGTCGGQGQVITTSQTPFGVFQQVSLVADVSSRW
jgi:DnaJ-class molecular chaperone